MKIIRSMLVLDALGDNMVCSTQKIDWVRYFGNFDQHNHRHMNRNKCHSSPYKWPHFDTAPDKPEEALTTLYALSS